MDGLVTYCIGLYAVSVGAEKRDLLCHPEQIEEPNGRISGLTETSVGLSIVRTKEFFLL